MLKPPSCCSRRVFGSGPATIRTSSLGYSLAVTHVIFCARKAPVSQSADLHTPPCQMTCLCFPASINCLTPVDHERKSNTTRPTSRPSESTTPRISVLSRQRTCQIHARATPHKEGKKTENRKECTHGSTLLTRHHQCANRMEHPSESNKIGAGSLYSPRIKNSL